MSRVAIVNRLVYEDLFHKQCKLNIKNTFKCCLYWNP